MTNTELFEQIRENHSEKKIISLTNKLIKKCSFNSGKDAENLCHLAYWLYVYGYDDEVHKVYAITKNIAFPGKSGFRVWDFILYIWGLEVYLQKNAGNEKIAYEIINLMDIYWSSSPLSKEAEAKRRSSFTYESVCYKEKIESATTTRYANSLRFIALFRMIGYTYTNLYPNLQKDIDKIIFKTKEYVEMLKESQ